MRLTLNWHLRPQASQRIYAVKFLFSHVASHLSPSLEVEMQSDLIIHK